MSRFLVSFCNTLPQGFPLAAYDYRTGDFEWIAYPDGLDPIGGATGICRLPEGYVVLLQHRVPGWPATLVLYGTDLRPRLTARLRQVSDAHSMIAQNGGLLVASTGANEIVRLTIDAPAGVVREESVWELGSVRSDADHLNSLAFFEDRTLVSSFGPKPIGDDPFSPRSGRIVELGTGRILCHNLLQPHSLAVQGGRLYCLESRRGRVWRFAMEESDLRGEVLLELPGYVRGIAFREGSMYVAASGERLKSKSKGTLADVPSGNPQALHCLIYKINLDTGAAEIRDLTPFGREIYDIVPLPDDSVYPRAGSAPESVISRQLAYDREHLRALEDLRLALEQLEELRRRQS